MINVIGIGLDGAKGLNAEMLALIEQATVLAGSDRHLSYFQNHPAEKLVFGNFTIVFETLRRRLVQEENIVVLVSGDPLFFGLGRLLTENFPPEKLVFHPHLSSVQLAFNRLKLTWHDANIVSVHGRSMNLLIPLLQKGVKKLAIFTDNNNHPGAIARFYRNLDLPTHYQFWICEDLGGPNEQVFSCLPEDIDTKTDQDFSSLNLVILVRQDSLDQDLLDLTQLPLLGINDAQFFSFEDRPGLITKREVRVQALAELALQPGQVIWDIGAGTGSVGIEIARLCPTSQIYAIEKSSMGMVLIERNCQRFQTFNVYPIYGNAPEILDNLPAPDRIFIGGSGGNLLEILSFCQEKLNPQGRIVIALATLENLASCLTWFKKHQWDCSLQHLQISRSVPFANLTRLNPINPVNLITAFPLLLSPESPISTKTPKKSAKPNLPDSIDSFD
ncbi:MAG: precorrin-6y C5,15-methyltransferase (decarboxylating) subunit CbiE [Microcystaceae cyanobacterium]